MCDHLPQLITPAQPRESGPKNSCFSLRSERVGPHIQHSSFSGCYPRKWFLSLLSWSADWTQHMLDPRRLQRTMGGRWTSVWALTVPSLSFLRMSRLKTHPPPQRKPKPFPASPYSRKELDSVSYILVFPGTAWGTGFCLPFLRAL